MGIKIRNKNAFFLIGMLVCVNFCIAQKFNIRGVINDNKMKLIKYASVNLKSTTDSNYSIFSVSDSVGAYLMQQIPAGQYEIKVKSVELVESKIVLQISKDTVINFSLPREEKMLGGVTVVGTSAPKFERKRDRFVYTLNNSPLIVGNNIWDVLKQTPMVQTSEQGLLSVLGNPQGATVYINRRKFQLSGDDLIRFLREMPSDNLVKIEVLTIPPPFYDANGPVIDIILKKLEINGVRGNTSLTYGRSQVNTSNGNFSLDYNNNAYNQSLMLSGFGGNAFQQIERETTVSALGPSSLISSNIESNSKRKGISGYTDIRYSINPVLTIGTQWIANSSNSDLLGKGEEYDAASVKVTPYQQNIHTKNNVLNGNAFLKYYSEKKNTYFELGSDYLTNRLNQTTEFYLAPPLMSLITDVPQQIDNIAIKADFSKKVLKDIFMELGAKWSKSDIVTPYEVLGNSGGVWAKLDRYSATFDYNETIQSAYITLEKDFNSKWSGKLGLKVENSIFKTVTSGVTLQKNTNKFTFLFPIGYLNFKPNEKHSFSLTSKTSNSRPDYSSLNPARILLGPRTVTEGNPYLNPSNGGIVELMYSFKDKYYFGATYSVANNQFTQANTIIDPDTLLVKWNNWGDVKQFNFWIFTQRNVVKNKWSLIFNSNLGYYGRSFDNQAIRVVENPNNWQLFLTLNNSFTNIFSPKIRMYLNLSYRTPGRFGYWRDNTGSWRVDLGGNYSIPKAGMRLSLAVNDLFKFADRNVFQINKTDLQATSVLTNNDRRSIRFTISKSFGNLKAKKLDQRETSNEEEKQRLK